MLKTMEIRRLIKFKRRKMQKEEKNLMIVTKITINKPIFDMLINCIILISDY